MSALLRPVNGPLLAVSCLRRPTTARALHQARASLMATPRSYASAPTPGKGVSITDLPKSWTYTASLPPDPLFPTPADSHKTPRDKIGPRQVRDAAFTWVRPERAEDPELLGVSPAAMRDIGIKDGDQETEEFRQTVAGNRLHGWDEEKLQGGYPWAQCYGGFQFGQWAGQLGDGRAISLFESKNTDTGAQYELQLKGAGLTPYSRFADGKAVLRSSIREFVVSEALNALGIPSTRALSLTLLPHSKVRRETIEPGAIVLRFAESWIRLGNFDILRSRGDRKLIRILANYVAENVLGGWDKLPGRLSDPAKAADSASPDRGVAKNDIQGEGDESENRYARLFREVSRRNAETVAKWQAYGFMNGVLNTDNTSIMGLSLDFGPFAFMDDFDPSYTPNHDDHMLRYSYRNQPTIIWWNLVRFGESLAELIGAGDRVDDPALIENGIQESEAEAVIARAEKIITQTGDEYKAVFMAEYKRLMTARLGLRKFRDSDFDDLFSKLLDTMDGQDLDFNHFFRRLSSTSVSELATPEDRARVAPRFFHDEGATGGVTEGDAKAQVAEWLGAWRARVLEDWEGGEAAWDGERMKAMKAVNPSFIPRSWILDEVIRRVEKEGERDVLRRVMHMALHPFEERWDGEVAQNGETYKGDKAEEERWIGDVPRPSRAMQCSCSS